jgi:hypothetical protein
MPKSIAHPEEELGGGRTFFGKAQAHYRLGCAPVEGWDSGPGMDARL